MPEPVISLRDVIKDYKIYSRRGQKLKETLTLNRRRYHEVKRALDGVSFDVYDGECVGIIGDNGSGKSTILKILAGTSYPTAGTVDVTGEVSYLLNVTTGFNFDFTGRENIFTKCALLGMPPDVIEEKYPSIHDFSGLKERIDHPIKTYSMGMIMRLGFSVAIHVPFDILIVDEVLSVGDNVFQRKCINGIRKIIESGKTVIITSHALSDVATFCDRLMMLKDGQIVMTGAPEEVIQSYIQECDRTNATIESPGLRDDVLQHCNEILGGVHINHVAFLNGNGEPSEEIQTGDPLQVKMDFTVAQPIESPCLRIQFMRNDGLLVMGDNTYRQDLHYGPMQGHYETVISFPSISLLEGDYFVTIGLWPDEYKSWVAKTPFDIHDYRYVISVKSHRSDGGGLVRSNATWTLNKLPDAPPDES